MGSIMNVEIHIPIAPVATDVPCLLRRIYDPTLNNITIFNPQHNKTLAIALMLAD